MGNKLKPGLEQEQAARVMERFHKGRLLRTSGGETLHPGNSEDEKKAKAIAYSEGKAAGKRGIESRTWKGSKRIRPRKAEK